MMDAVALEGKVALITGGARRIGAHVAETLHQQGMNLALHYRSSPADAERLRRRLHERRGGSVQLLEADLADPEVPARLVQQTVSHYGRLDVLINNASTFYPTPLGETTPEQFDDLVGINLRAPYFMVQAARPHLEESRGCVINMADIYAERPMPSFPLYCAAKAGVVSLTRSLARALGPHVRVNAVAPGAILWPEGEGDDAARERLVKRTPLKRTGEAEEVARAILFLVRDATFTTGQVLAIDGGRSVVI